MSARDMRRRDPQLLNFIPECAEWHCSSLLMSGRKTLGVRVSLPEPKLVLLTDSNQGECAPLLTENEVGPIPTLSANLWKCRITAYYICLLNRKMRVQVPPLPPNFKMNIGLVIERLKIPDF